MHYLTLQIYIYSFIYSRDVGLAGKGRFNFVKVLGLLQFIYGGFFMFVLVLYY